MRIVFVSAMSGHPWGGSEELWSQAALHLHGAGHQVSASVTYWPQLSAKVLELGKRGIQLYVRQPEQPDLVVRLYRKVRRRFVAREKKEFQWLRLQKPDLVIISQGGNMDGLEWMKYCRNAGLQFAVIVQSNYEPWWPGDDEGIEARKSYGAARKVFCVSRHNLELLERQLGESLPNAEVVWNPCNMPVAQPVAWPAEDGIWKLACVARLEPAAKGQDLLLQVLSRPQWKTRPVEASFYGAGPCELNLKQLSKLWQLSNVHFRGHVADIRALWQDSHLLVLPSRYEGLPLALVEAMWCGRPAVVTDVGGNAEVCVDGETGFVAAAPVSNLLEQTMECAWERRHEWQSMGKAARARAERLIPEDAVGVFCRHLVGCLDQQNEVGT